MNIVNHHVHSHISLLDGLSKFDQIAKYCAELGQKACSITDHGSISGAVSFINACKKENIKPIVGVEAYCANELASTKTKENKVSHQVILAKNLKGWYKLIKLVSKSNDKENFYYKPRIDLNIIKEICDDNLISFSGHLGSTLHSRADSMTDMKNYVELMKDIFGPNNFFIEIQLIDSENSKEMVRQAERMRELAKLTNTKCVATGDAHYTRPEDADDHRILLCSSLQTNLREINKKIRYGNCPLESFFKSNNFSIISYDQAIKCGNTEEEIENTNLIADMCEEYDVTGPPKLPKFDCPNNMDENEYLRQLCRKGWKKKSKEDWDITVYSDRVKKELEVIEGAGLAGYFLIVQDYVQFAKDQGWLVGTGRGSVAGSLVSHLLDITDVDPIKYGLIFERFYNASRSGSLPDIDMDFPISKRKHVINYIREKYGHDKVSQMATFGRLQGKAALKEVLRAHSACSFEEMNAMSKDIPQEAEISDQLEDAGEKSIIRWTLMHDPERLQDYCRIDGAGNFHGEYSEYFEQAIRLEGTYKSQGKHAAGIILSSEPLDNVCPMIHDKNSSEKIAGMVMEDLESMGHVKFDLLGLLTLDKLMAVNNLLKFGRIEE